MKRKKTKILSLLLTFAMVLSTLPFAVSAASYTDEFRGNYEGKTINTSGTYLVHDGAWFDGKEGKAALTVYGSNVNVTLVFEGDAHFYGWNANSLSAQATSGIEVYNGASLTLRRESNLTNPKIVITGGKGADASGTRGAGGGAAGIGTSSAASPSSTTGANGANSPAFSSSNSLTLDKNLNLIINGGEGGKGAYGSQGGEASHGGMIWAQGGYGGNGGGGGGGGGACLFRGSGRSITSNPEYGGAPGGHGHSAARAADDSYYCDGGQGGLSTGAGGRGGSSTDNQATGLSGQNGGKAGNKAVEFTGVKYLPLEVAVQLLPGQGTGYVGHDYVTEGHDYTLPQSTNQAPDGMEFAGWECKGQVYPVGTSFNITQALNMRDSSGYLTFTATYKALPDKTISFLPGDGGQGEMQSQTVQKGKQFTLPTCGFTSEDYDFIGWRVSSDTSRTYQPNDTITVQDNVTVTAQWKLKDKVTVSFDGGKDAQGTMAPQKVERGTQFELPNCEFTKPGYEFAGWQLSQKQTEQPVHPGAEVTGIQVLAKSGENTAAGELASNLFDGKEKDTKWCANNDSGWVVFDIGTPTVLGKMTAYHAGQSSSAWDSSSAGNTKAYALQAFVGTDTPTQQDYTDESKWKTVGAETNNQKTVADTVLEMNKAARYFRLKVTDCGDPTSTHSIRFYELKLFEAEKTAPKIMQPGDKITVEQSVTLTANWKAEKPVITGHSVTLNAQIDVNFHVRLPETVTAQDYMLFTVPNAAEPLKVEVGAAKKVEGKAYNYIFTCPMAAKEMTDTIQVQFYSGGAEVLTEEYSVQTYAQKALESIKDKPDQKATADLICAMLNYGTAAQNYFGYHTERLANSILTEAQKTVSAAKDSFAGHAPQVGTELAGIHFYGVSLNLVSRTELLYYFTLDEGKAITDYTFSVNGKVLTAEQNANTKFYCVRVPVYAYDLDKDEVLTVAGKDSTESFTVTYSAYAYANNMYKNEQLRPILDAMAAYHTAADAYQK